MNFDSSNTLELGISRWISVGALVFLLLVIVQALAGCKKEATSPEEKTKEPINPAGAKQVGASWIKAEPNPIPADSLAGTTISWHAGDHFKAEIWVSRDEKPAILFAGGARGSQKAEWIQTGSSY